MKNLTLLLSLLFAVNLCTFGQTDERKVITLSVDKTSLSFNASGGQGTIKVTTNASDWSVREELDWCQTVKNGNILTVYCTENANTDSKTGTFYISDGGRNHSIRVTQAGAEPVLTVSQSSFQFDAKGEQKTLAVNTNVSNWTVSNTAKSWYSVTKNGNTLVISCIPNRDSDIRTDFFNIYAGGKTARVDIEQSSIEQKNTEQKGNNATDTEVSISKISAVEQGFSVSPNSLSFDTSGGSQSITVNAADWATVGIISWCPMTKNGNTITLSCETNSSGAKRLDYFYIKSGEKKVRVMVEQK
jgi:hypothetical protein